MPDDIIQTTEQNETGAPAPAGGGDGAATRIRELNQESAARRHENKQLKEQNSALEAQLNDLAQKLKLIDALGEKLSGMEKALQAEREARQAAEVAARKTQIATKHGLPAALAARLQGQTDEEIERDAQELAGLIPAAVNAQLARVSVGGGAGTPNVAEMAKRIKERASGKDASNSPFFDMQTHVEKGGGLVE